MNERELFGQLSDSIPEQERELMQYVDRYNRSSETVFSDLTNFGIYGSSIVNDPTYAAQNLLRNANDIADAFATISCTILEHNSPLTAVDDWVSFASGALADLQTKSFVITQQDLLPIISTEELQKHAEDYLRGYLLGDVDYENNWIIIGYPELLKDLIGNILHQSPTVVDEAYSRARDSEIGDDSLEYSTDTDFADHAVNLPVTIATITSLLNSQEKIIAYLDWCKAPSPQEKPLYDTFCIELDLLQLASKQQARDVGRSSEIPPVLRSQAFNNGFILSMAVAMRLVPKDQDPLQALEPHIPALFEKFTTAMQKGMSADVALYSHPYATRNLSELSFFAKSMANTLYPSSGEYCADTNRAVNHFLSGFDVGYEVYHTYASFEKKLSDFVTSLDNDSMS